MTWYNVPLTQLSTTYFKNAEDKIYNMKVLKEADDYWKQVIAGDGASFRLRYDVQLYTKTTDDHLKDSVKKFRLSGGWLILDIDIEKQRDEEFDHNKGLELIFNYAYNIVSFLCLSESTYKLFFSGKKGVHIFIRQEYFDFTPNDNLPAEVKNIGEKLIDKLLLFSPRIDGKEFCKIDKSVFTQGKMRNPTKIEHSDRKFYTEFKWGEKFEDVFKRSEKYTPNTLDTFNIPDFKLDVFKYPECITHAFFADEHNNLHEYISKYVSCRHDAQRFLTNKFKYLKYGLDELERILRSFQHYHNIDDGKREYEIRQFLNETKEIETICGGKYCGSGCPTTPDATIDNNDDYYFFELKNKRSVIIDKNDYDYLEKFLKFKHISMRTYKRMRTEIYLLNSSEFEKKREEVNLIKSEKKDYVFKDFSVNVISFDKKEIVYVTVDLTDENFRSFLEIFYQKNKLRIFSETRDPAAFKFMSDDGRITPFIKYQIDEVKDEMISLGFKNTKSEFSKSEPDKLKNGDIEMMLYKIIKKRNLFEEAINVKWDGIDRISNFIRTIQFDPLYHNEKEQNVRKKVLVNMLLLMLHGQISPTGLSKCVPPIIVFCGEQGIGKTTLTLTLGGKRDDELNVFKNLIFENYKYSGKDKTESKLPLATHMVCDLAEFDKLDFTSEHDNAEFKSIALSEKLSFRELYEKTISDYYRRAVIVASSNKYNILPSDFGERRAVIMSLKNVDWETLNEMESDILQLWVQVYEYSKLLNLSDYTISTHPKAPHFNKNIAYFRFEEKVYFNLRKNIKGSEGKGTNYILKTICDQLGVFSTKFEEVSPYVDRYMKEILKLENCREKVNGNIYYRLTKCVRKVDADHEEDDNDIEDVEFKPEYDDNKYDSPIPQILKELN